MTTVTKHSGFTIIEFLVALLVIAIGVFGYAKLQLATMSTSNEARYSQTVNTAILDIAQRIEANREAALDGEFNSNNFGEDNNPVVVVDCLGEAANCTRQQFVDYEIATWFIEASKTIPQLKFSINHVNGESDISILLTWDAKRMGSSVENCDAAATQTGSEHQCRSVNLWID